MNRVSRLLFIVPRYGSIFRGVESFAAELVSRLNTARFEVTVLSGHHIFDIPGIQFEKGRLVSREGLGWIDCRPWLCRLLRRVGLGGAADIEALTLLRGYRGHWAPDAFDIVVPLGGSWSYRFARQAFPEARIVSIGQAGPVAADLRRSNVFVGLTPHAEVRARQISPNLSTCIIPNGVDTERFTPSTEASALRCLQQRVILCAAALVPEKRHDLLFNAVMRLPDHVRVKCVGAGSHRVALEKHPLAKAGRVEFSQHTFAEMPAVYRGADVFSLASPDEAFGIVFWEAMAAGLPVVAHDGPRQRYVVDRGGILCDVNRPQAYGEALLSVLDTAPSQQARSQALRFDWSRIAAEYDRLFSGLGSRNP